MRKSFLIIGFFILVLVGIGVVYFFNYKEENIAELKMESFVRTYQVFNVIDSNDEKYVYLTIRQYQVEEVETVKVKKELCKFLNSEDNYLNKFYEFKFETNKKINSKTEDNIKSIFKNMKLIEINDDLSGGGVSQRNDNL